MGAGRRKGRSSCRRRPIAAGLFRADRGYQRKRGNRRAMSFGAAHDRLWLFGSAAMDSVERHLSRWHNQSRRGPAGDGTAAGPMQQSII